MSKVVLESCWYRDGKPSSRSASAFSQRLFTPVNRPERLNWPSSELTSRIPVSTFNNSTPNFNECEPRLHASDSRKFMPRGVWNCGTDVVLPIRCNVPPGKLKTGIPPQIDGSDGAFLSPISSVGQPEPKFGGSWKYSPSGYP